MRINPTAQKILFATCLLLCTTPFVTSPMALLGGFVFSMLVGTPFAEKRAKATGLLLKASVVGLGFGMNVHSALEVGKQGLWLTIASITLVLTLGYLLGRWMKMSRKSAHLLASGTAICGGSAIAAVSTAIGANERDISVSLAVVFLLNSVALLIFPPIGKALQLSQHQFGLWAAIAIHDTSSVVGAGHAYGSEALSVATTVKLARALWIIPLSLLSIALFRKNGNKKVSIPWFIGFFILAMLANSYLPIGNTASTFIVHAAKAMLVVCLFLIGSNLSLNQLKTIGVKPLFLGVILWITVSVLSLLAIVKLL